MAHPDRAALVAALTRIAQDAAFRRPIRARYEADSLLVREHLAALTADDALRRENERLREALGDIANGMAPEAVLRHLDTDAPDAFRGRMWTWSQVRARAALAAPQEEEG